MKSILKMAAITFPLLFALPSYAQVSWGVDLHFGTPPPRHEVILAWPYPEAVWIPGYYNYYPGHRYAWRPGYWRRPERFEHRGWGRYRHDGWERREYNRHGDFGHDRDDRHDGHGRFGRIR